MHIKFVLSATLPYAQPSYPFPINMIDLENAISNCYLGLGTPYNPIAIDNFVEIGKNVFPNINRETTISVSLEPDGVDDIDKGLQLVCCMVRNVGKSFVVGNHKDLGSYWENIFKGNPKLMYGAPDGTLFVSPDIDKVPIECSVRTLAEHIPEYISYTIMFSMPIKDSSGYERKYYFILDPLVKISSGGGTV